MPTWCRLHRLLSLCSAHKCCSIRSKYVGSESQLITKTTKGDRSYKEKARQFIDFKRVYVKAGNGGNGCMSFLSLFANEFAGPDGGDGGNGGHIVFQADNRIRSLTHLKAQYKAEAGENGRNKNRFGRNAEHLYIQVPVGTMFKDENFQLLADLSSHDNHYIAARGGAGGKGNRFFMSSTDTAPTSYEEGGHGQERIMQLELKIIANVGLVGFPNAGKSTLLRALSRARPKVAAYPFTTLRPHIGIIEYKDSEQVAVADIPGLIPGAHLNKGLGISFLKHIERCVGLLFVLDLSVSDPSEQLDILKFELDQYKEGLSQRPHAIVANKIDLPVAKENLQKLRDHVSDSILIFPLSAKEKIDIKPLVRHIRILYDRHHEAVTNVDK